LKLAVKFYPLNKEAAVQIDITAIVNKWLDSSLPNYGLAIMGHRVKPKASGCVSWGSAYSNDNTLIPIIDVNYKLNIFCLLPPAPGLTYVAKLLGSKK
jgi:hypothetical protein